MLQNLLFLLWIWIQENCRIFTLYHGLSHLGRRPELCGKIHLRMHKRAVASTHSLPTSTILRHDQIQGWSPDLVLSCWPQNILAWLDLRNSGMFCGKYSQKYNLKSHRNDQKQMKEHINFLQMWSWMFLKTTLFHLSFTLLLCVPQL